MVTVLRGFRLGPRGGARVRVCSRAWNALTKRSVRDIPRNRGSWEISQCGETFRRISQSYLRHRRIVSRIGARISWLKESTFISQGGHRGKRGSHRLLSLKLGSHVWITCGSTVSPTKGHPSYLLSPFSQRSSTNFDI